MTSKIYESPAAALEGIRMTAIDAVAAATSQADITAALAVFTASLGTLGA